MPFVHGGAEVHVARAGARARAHGYDAELVSVPFKWYPKEEILAARGRVAAARSQREQRPAGRPRRSRTKFPTYFVRHPHKVAWLIHQYRAAYELCGTAYSDFAHTERRRRPARRADPPRHRDARRVPRACSRTRATPPTGCEKLQRPRRAEPLYHPPRLAPRLTRRVRTATTCCRWAASSRSSASISAIRAMARVDPPLRLIVAGDGTQRAERRTRSPTTLGVADRVTFLGAVDDDDSIELYAGALAVVYPPYDEDFGYVTLEAFLARQAGGHDCTDSGGPNEFVVDGVNGCVCEPTPEALADAINAARARDRRRGGRARRRRLRACARAITWDGVIESCWDTPRLQRGHPTDMTKLIIQIPCLNEADDAAGDARRSAASSSRHRRHRDPGHRRRVARRHGGRRARAGVDHVVRFRRNKGLAAAFTRRHRRVASSRRRLHRQHRRRQSVRRARDPDAARAAARRHGRHRDRRSQHPRAAATCRGASGSCSGSAAGSCGRCRARRCPTRRAAFAPTRAKPRCG